MTTLIRQGPKTFLDDPEKQARVTAMIHCQVETGLAVRDTVQLERDQAEELDLSYAETLERLVLSVQLVRAS